jgi:hypothetical protein
MSAIDSDLIREIIGRLRNDITIQSKIGKDSRNNLAIHPGKYNPIHNVFPQITVEVLEGGSEAQFPSSHDSLIITIFVDKKEKDPIYAFMVQVKDAILALFNRKGGSLNNIDVVTNTGVRICQILKGSIDFSYDDTIQKNYCEIIFSVVRSEGESFAPSDAGDVPWQ